MKLINKTQENNYEYCYFTNVSRMDKKALKNISFEFIRNDIIDGIKCEV